jgi:hypothetical protein
MAAAASIRDDSGVGTPGLEGKSPDWAAKYASSGVALPNVIQAIWVATASLGFHVSTRLPAVNAAVALASSVLVVLLALTRANPASKRSSELLVETASWA